MTLTTLCLDSDLLMDPAVGNVSVQTAFIAHGPILVPEQKRLQSGISGLNLHALLWLPWVKQLVEAAHSLLAWSLDDI